MTPQRDSHSAAESRAARTYREEAVMTATPERLVQMLLERSRAELSQLVTDLEASATAEVVGPRITTLHDLISELRGALDAERGGEIAAELDVLYEFVLQQLSEANSTHQLTPVHAAAEVIGRIEEGWRDVLLQ